MNEASRAELGRLLALPLDDRFAAIAQVDLQLTDAHRRELVRSLQEKAPAKSPIAAKTASRWARWRARLPYRASSLLAVATWLSVAGGLYLVARYHTPERWVASAYDYDFQVRWRFPDGRFSDDRLARRSRYTLMRREGVEGILTVWEPAFGYAETRVPLKWLLIPRKIN